MAGASLAGEFGCADLLMDDRARQVAAVRAGYGRGGPMSCERGEDGRSSDIAAAFLRFRPRRDGLRIVGSVLVTERLRSIRR